MGLALGSNWISAALIVTSLFAHWWLSERV